ncbi:MAG TPA: D-alanine--D-alanine ligase [Candidatus Hydrogenedens sp.]|nr:D-alanine--D-alanine ligase [Candidatus Hydrogenedens sp.]HOL20286.1 D-alanine--D-alanine ligase [Candidatus Hydrogenedens sp.]HPP58138.1 D-alanine--D-alanine ligase [Candidatus Hydrogenedens sp.]
MENTKTFIPMRVGVLMGGVSSEHEISLLSGEGVVRALKTTEYEPIPIIIHRDFNWEFPEKRIMKIEEALVELKRLGIQVVFNALHGAYGEDGRIQGLLDWLHIPYTGSDCLACALAMNKVCSKAVAKMAGIRVADHIVFRKETWIWDRSETVHRVEKELGFPVVIKPSSQGSSVGVTIAGDGETVLVGIEQAMELDNEVLVEKFIKGREVTCGVWDCEEGKPPCALPVTEICPKTSSFFDYTAKYTPGATEEITPAPIAPEQTRKVQEMAVRAHQVIGCSTWSRSDFIIDEEGPVWIEINPIPGLTPTSLYPQEAKCAGISYEQMVQKFVEHALNKRV